MLPEAKSSTLARLGAEATTGNCYTLPLRTLFRKVGIPGSHNHEGFSYAGKRSLSIHFGKVIQIALLSLPINWNYEGGGALG
jgi:hypothetical protein